MAAATPASLPRTIARGRFVVRRAGARAIVHDALHYVQCRPLGPRERSRDRALFNRDQETVTSRRAEGELLERAARRVLFHHIVLSPGAEHDVLDLRRWARCVIDELSQQLRLQLFWVAAVHRNTEHAHVHVLLAATGERRGVSEPVRLRTWHYAVLRHAGDCAADRLVVQEQCLSRVVARELAALGQDHPGRSDGAAVSPGAPGDGRKAGEDAGAPSGGKLGTLFVAAALASALAHEERADPSPQEHPRRRRRGPPGRDAGRGD